MKKPRIPRRLARLMLWAALPVMVPPAFAATASGGAHVVMDGSLGRGGALQPVNNTYNVTADLGKQVGPNLFQSFGQLNLSAGEKAAFSGPASVHNVLARVTGGAASSIDGTLQCNIPAANFYLINPSGIIFGPDASIDVAGSFAVTTANRVKLGSGGAFTASASPADSVLTSAAPAAFGFLGPRTPAGLTSKGAALQVPHGKSLLVVGGPVQVAGGRLAAPGGRVGITAVASTGDVNFDAATFRPTSVTATTLGAIAVSGGGAVTTAGPTGGSVVIRCGSLSLADGSSINADTSGSGPGGTVDVHVTGQAILSGADSSGNLSQISAQSKDGATGAAGSISLTAGSLQILDGAQLIATTSGPGAGGKVNVAVSGDITISGSDPSGPDSGIYADSNSIDQGGKAGELNISANSLSLLDGAQISAQSYGLGNAGSVTLTIAGAATLTGSDPSNTDSGVFADSNAIGPNGNAGSVSITAGSLQVMDGAYITATTFGQGTGGNVRVNVAGRATFSGTDPAGNGSGVFAISDLRGLGSGNAGTIAVTAGSLQLIDGAYFAADTYGTGNAGPVKVTVGGASLLDGRNGPGLTGITSTSYATDAGGRAGDITFATGSLQLAGGAQISSDTYNSAGAGLVSINASGQLVADGQGSSFFTGISSDSNQGAAGRAGDLAVSAGSLTVQNGASISSGAFGAGNGGNVTVTVTGAAVLFGTDAAGNGSGLLARANPGSIGNAGSVTLAAASLQVSGGAAISSTTLGTGAGGDVTVNISGPAVLTGTNRIGNASGLFAGAEKGSTGNAGSVTLAAASLQVSSGAAISSTTFGTGAGGDVTVKISGPAVLSGTNGMGNGSGVFAAASPGSAGSAGAVIFNAQSLQILQGAVISAGTFGSGAGGTVNVAVPGQILLDSQGYSQALTGISAEATAGSTGNAGSVTVNAGGLQVLDGAEISSNTSGRGTLGNVTVAVSGPALIDSRGFAAFVTGISAAQTAQGGAGNAGDVAFSATSLRMLGGSEIGSSTSGAGGGGAVKVSVSGSAVLSGSDAAGNATGITAQANPGSTGNAGAIKFDAGTLLMDRGAGISSATFSRGAAGPVGVSVGALQMRSSAEISSNTSGSGPGGDVKVTVTGTASFDGQAAAGRPTGLLVRATPGSTGDAGSIILDAGSVSIFGGAEINSSTFGPGKGGDIAIKSASVRIFGQNQPGIFAETYNPAAGGNGGIIGIDAGSLILSGTALISAETQGSGSAQSVAIHAGSVSMSGPQTAVDSRSSGTGSAGSVTIDAGARLQLDRASLEVDAGAAQGGDLTVTGAELAFQGGSLRAGSGGGLTGGNVFIRATDQARLLGTRVTATGGGNGGSITIDPSLVLLDRASLNANGGRNGGNITVHPALLLNSGSVLTASGTLGVSGNVAVTPPDVTLAGSLVALPGALAHPEAALFPQCTQRFGVADMSSFLVTGKGGVAPQPDGWQPDNIDGEPTKRNAIAHEGVPVPARRGHEEMQSGK